MSNKKNRIIKKAMIDGLMEKGAISHPDGKTPVINISIDDMWGILAPLFGEAMRRTKAEAYREGWWVAYKTYASS